MTAARTQSIDLVREYTIPSQRTAVRAPATAAAFLRPLIPDPLRECFFVLCLNSKNRITHHAIVSIGTLNATLVHPRETLRLAVQVGAAAIILAHNHPTGIPTPSQEDIALTRRMHKAGEIVGIDVLDHIIIGDLTCDITHTNAFQSLKELGVL